MRGCAFRSAPFFLCFPREKSVQPTTLYLYASSSLLGKLVVRSNAPPSLLSPIAPSRKGITNLGIIIMMGKGLTTSCYYVFQEKRAPNGPGRSLSASNSKLARNEKKARLVHTSTPPRGGGVGWAATQTPKESCSPPTGKKSSETRWPLRSLGFEKGIRDPFFF